MFLKAATIIPVFVVTWENGGVFTTTTIEDAYVFVYDPKFCHNKWNKWQALAVCLCHQVLGKKKKNPWTGILHFPSNITAPYITAVWWDQSPSCLFTTDHSVKPIKQDSDTLHIILSTSIKTSMEVLTSLKINAIF